MTQTKCVGSDADGTRSIGRSVFWTTAIPIDLGMDSAYEPPVHNHRSEPADPDRITSPDRSGEIIIIFYISLREKCRGSRHLTCGAGDGCGRDRNLPNAS